MPEHAGATLHLLTQTGEANFSGIFNDQDQTVTSAPPESLPDGSRQDNSPTLSQLYLTTSK